MKNLFYLIRKSDNSPYYIYDIQIFEKYGVNYYRQILRFSMQSNKPQNFIKSYGFKIEDIELNRIDITSKILKNIGGFLYCSNAAKNLITAFNKMKIKKTFPNIVFN